MVPPKGRGVPTLPAVEWSRVVPEVVLLAFTGFCLVVPEVVPMMWI
jgi:hypothetical protein